MNYRIPDERDAGGRTPLPFRADGHEPGVWTDSKLKKAFLVAFRGYTVSRTRSVPRATLLGEVVYRTRWLLVQRR